MNHSPWPPGPAAPPYSGYGHHTAQQQLQPQRWSPAPPLLPGAVCAHFPAAPAPLAPAPPFLPPPAVVGIRPPQHRPTAPQVHAAALDHASRVVAEGGFAGFSAVVPRVLSAYGAPDWSCLGLGPSPLAVPCLEYLWRVEQQVSNFVAAFAGVRGIATLADLEAEAVALLRGLCIPALREAFPPPQEAPCKNPEEIELPDDDDGDGDAAAAADGGTGEQGRCFEGGGFEALGLGPLLRHPAVLHYFQPSPALLGGGAPQELPTAPELFPYLVEFAGGGGREKAAHVAGPAATKRRRRGGQHTPGSAGWAAFGAFLASELGVPDIRELGIRLSPTGLDTELQLLQHVQAAQREAAAAEAQRALADLQRRDADRRRDAEQEACRRREAAKPVPGSIPALRIPPIRAVAAFLETCEAALEGPWRPSAAKMRPVVQGAVGDGGPEAHRQLLEVATEYAMLHLGGSKFRRKRLEFADAQENNEEDTEEDEDEDEEEKEAACGAGGAGTEAVGEVQENSKAVRGGSGSDTEADTGSSSSGGSDVSSSSSREGEGSPEEAAEGRREQGGPVPTVPAASIGGSTRVLVRTGGLPQRRALPWEGTLRAPQEAHGGEVEAPEFPACIPWHQGLDLRDLFAVGRWGEALAFQFLVSQYPGWTVKWLNVNGESKAAYDIEMRSPSGALHETQFVEVKTSSRGDRNAFEMSLWEWEFAAKAGKQYSIMRVTNAGKPGQTRIRILDNPYQAVQEHRMGLCLIY